MERRSETTLYADSATAERGARPSPRRTRSRPAPEFPGCSPFTLKREDLDTWDGRFEYWDGETETAWMVREPTTDTHERPSHRLAGLCQVIAAVRGSAIECLGAMDLVLRGAGGERRRILQADQSVYLHPARARLPQGAGMVIGEHDFPDVVVEVDHTTDVRRGKLWLYEEWGFPEVWVEVPERGSPSRAARRRPGLVIHRLEDGGYRPATESGVFPGWRAEEIHEAMNEDGRSVRTNAILERVGRALGAREGTGPDDDPLLHSLRSESRTEGRAEGRQKGWAEGRQEGRSEMVREMLSSRGLEVSETFPADVPGFAEAPGAAVVAAALACDSERDFHARMARIRVR